jgi:Ca2+-binding EF-hand superfamily protein
MNNSRNAIGGVNDSETNSQIVNELTLSKIEALTQAFRNMDKNSDSKLSKQELIDFLDSNLTGGRKFDRDLANKIFSSLDLDRNDYISVEEFIQKYTSIEEEIKETVREFQAKYMYENENKTKLEQLMLSNKREKLNAEGIGIDALATIEMVGIEFLRNIPDITGISIRIIYRGEAKDTEVVYQISSFTEVSSIFEL